MGRPVPCLLQSPIYSLFQQNIPFDAPLPPSPMSSSSSSSPLSVCLPEDEVVAAHEPDIETVDVHPKLNFDVSDSCYKHVYVCVL